MKPGIKRLWLKALRSGKYKQGKHRLRHKDAYCCLGVLCDVYAKRKHARWREGLNSNYGLFEELHALPSCVVKWAGLSEKNPLLPSKCTSLAIENDEGKSFKEIADLIEEHL